MVMPSIGIEIQPTSFSYRRHAEIAEDKSFEII